MKNPWKSFPHLRSYRIVALMVSIASMALLLFLLSLFASPATTDPLFYMCSTIGSFLSNSNTFTSNIEHLVSTLSSNAPATGFASYTTDISPPPTYGFILCRGDTNADTCHSCIHNAISDIKKLCPNDNNVTIWYDYCQLSYSSPDYLFVPNVQMNIKVFMFNTMNISADRLSRFEGLTTALIGNISDLAVTNTSQLFATGEAAMTATDITYGLVQCSRDLSIGDCRACLQGIVKQMTELPLRGKRGLRLMGIWCSMRFELYKFYNGTSMLQVSPNKAPSTTNGSAPNTTHQPADLSHGGIALDFVLDCLRGKAY